MKEYLLWLAQWVLQKETIKISRLLIGVAAFAILSMILRTIL